MRFGHREACLAHDPGGRHPDSPDRIRAVREALTTRHGVEYVAAEPADRATVTAVHTPEYVDRLEAFCAEGGGQWDPDTVAVEATWEAALASAGLAVWAATEAFAGAEGRATPFSLGRPPGHHAVPDDAMGFCFLNNAAIAVEAARDAGAERVAVFDWDVHHGNGTQAVFLDDPAVFYASIHERGLYPGTGDLEETGAGEAAGTTLNLPLGAGAGDPEYRYAFEEAVAPAIERFDPDLLVVSAGFDAHRHDPISRMRVSSEGYALLADRVRGLARRCDAGLGFVLEGGYGLDTLSEGVAMVHETFDGRDPIEPDDGPNEDVRSTVARLRARLDG